MDRNRERATALLRRAVRLHDGDPVDPPPWLARCVEGDAPSYPGCRVLSLRQRLGVQGGKPDLLRAHALADTACVGEDRIACADVALDLVDGVGVVRDVSRGIALLDADCWRGVGAACRGLGEALSRGAGGPAKDERIRDAFKGACNLKDATACARYGTFHVTGMFGLPSNLDLARLLHDDACKLGSGEGCYLAAGPLSTRSVAAHTRACALGWPTACHELGLATRDGRDGAVEDKGRALELLADACDGGLANACIDGRALATTAPIDAKRRHATASQFQFRLCALDPRQPGC